MKFLRLGSRLAGVLVFFAVQTSGQVSLPHMERIFGGTTRTMDFYVVSTNITRVFVSAESPRALFYADVNHLLTNAADEFLEWEIVPDYEGTENHGVPSHFAVDQISGKIFVCDEEEGLLTCDLTPGNLFTNIKGSVEAVHIESNYLFAVGRTNDTDYTMYFGTVDVSGVFTELPGSPIDCPVTQYPTIVTHPTNDLLYLLDSQGAQVLFKSTNTFDAFTGSTTFDAIPLPNPMTNWNGEMRVGIGPDSRIFVNGLTNITVFIAYSDDDGATWTNVNTGIESAGTTRGLNYTFVGHAGRYEVYLGMLLNTNSGALESWTQLPRQPGGWVETHANMGAVYTDPLDSNIVYCTTDQGTGVSTNRGLTIWENNEGLTATQVEDIDFPPAKKPVWLAAKNGVWFTTNFVKNTEWSDARFTDGMAHAVGLDLTDTNTMTVYAGSRRIWKATNGTNWFQVHTELVQDGVSDGVFDGWIEDIEVNSNFVYAGYHGYAEDDADGMFLESTNSGSAWSRVATNIDVTDILYLEENGTDVVYVSANTYPTNMVTWGVYRYVPETGAWTHDFTNVALISDLDVATNGNVLAAGMDTGEYARVWSRDRMTGAWSLLPTNNLPLVEWPSYPASWLGPCMTVGYNADSNQVLYLGLLQNIYFLHDNSSNWMTTPYMQFRDGSVIHVLVWDDLMVGTGVGLYSQDIDSDGDGLSDTDETEFYFTDPASSDTDDDGIRDYEEIEDYATSPTNRDTDADGAIDGDELIAGTDPTNEVSVFEIATESSTAFETGQVFVIRWKSVDGQLYHLLRSTNLVTGFTQHVKNIFATAPLNSYTDEVSDVRRYYYQIGTK